MMLEMGRQPARLGSAGKERTAEPGAELLAFTSPGGVSFAYAALSQQQGSAHCRLPGGHVVLSDLFHILPDSEEEIIFLPANFLFFRK